MENTLKLEKQTDSRDVVAQLIIVNDRYWPEGDLTKRHLKLAPSVTIAASVR